MGPIASGLKKISGSASIHFFGCWLCLASKESKVSKPSFPIIFLFPACVQRTRAESRGDSRGFLAGPHSCSRFVHTAAVLRLRPLPRGRQASDTPRRCDSAVLVASWRARLPSLLVFSVFSFLLSRLATRRRFGRGQWCTGPRDACAGSRDRYAVGRAVG